MRETIINAINFHYDIYGSGVPIIFVHGLGMDQSMGEVVLSFLSGLGRP